MVVSKTGAFVLLAMLVAVVLVAELMEMFVGDSTNNILMVALLIFAGGVGGWFVRHHKIGMPGTNEPTDA